ncbi:tetratricopeptide repeat protein [Caulobacter sp. 17J65-9]|uniref:tetratricopeptide repeat protein n=1 Tax=Caulobacter sp. 17J65-9 TaxID=2709382 RepID=UPI0013C7BFF8|nr:tetratricopeptide repeat protein [Caulobacter sp. 17J65-9]NEX94546.1 tetratricopeptide repeat protein [Caulobacter sp. 17J65-9]
MLRSVSIAALLALLVQGGTAVAAPADVGAMLSDGGSVYGNYLAGRAAMQRGDSGLAARYLAAAAAADPDDAGVRERAFLAALMSGDVSHAATLVPTGEEGPAGVRSLGQMTWAVEALAGGHGPQADAAFKDTTVAFPHTMGGTLLKPWLAAAAGDWDRALAEPQTDRLTQLFSQLGRARLLEAHGRKKEAEAAYQQLAGDTAGASLFRIHYGEFLERAGRRNEAIAVYDVGLAETPSDGSLQRARARAIKRGRPPAPLTLKQGAAEALWMTAAALTAERQMELGLAYLRLSLRLDPEMDEAKMMVGDAMSAVDDEEAARGAWATVKAGSPHYVDARSRLAWSFQAAGESETAVSLARETVAATPGDTTSELALADVLRAAGHEQESVGVLDRLAKRTNPDWRVFYMRGVVLERLGRWDDAQVDLKHALDLRPDDPELLNYLGYSWIDRGVRVQEGMALIEKAVAQRPTSGAIQDSLAWGHYRLGEYPKAVELLERAVVLEPGDPAVNDHLGDAYWRVGRKREAGFQWKRVLTLNPDPTLRAAAEGKIEKGIDGEPAAAAK